MCSSDLPAQGVHASSEMKVQRQPESDQSQGKRKKKNKKKKAQQNYEVKPKREAPITLMSSEWLTEKPEDFEESWAGVLCPVGKRTLLVANRVRTCCR